MLRTRILASVAVAAALTVAVPGAVSAKRSDSVNPNCFGKGASQIAQGAFADMGIEGMGAHASTQENPRVGIGNLIRFDPFQDFVHQSEVAKFLGADC